MEKTITRHGVAARYTAPEDVPAYDRTWSRAMSELNLGNDERYLTSAVSAENTATEHATTAVLAAAPLTVQHTAVAVLVKADTDVAFLPRVTPVMVLTTAAPNSPNTSPAAFLATGCVAA